MTRDRDTTVDETAETIPIKEAAAASVRNREAIESADECACYYCLSVFPPSDVTDWADGEQTAICPNCGIDAVIPRRVASDRLLKDMRAYWFAPDK